MSSEEHNDENSNLDEIAEMDRLKQVDFDDVEDVNYMSDEGL
jgi:hypothetical protein